MALDREVAAQVEALTLTTYPATIVTDGALVADTAILSLTPHAATVTYQPVSPVVESSSGAPFLEDHNAADDDEVLMAVIREFLEVAHG